MTPILLIACFVITNFVPSTFATKKVYATPTKAASFSANEKLKPGVKLMNSSVDYNLRTMQVEELFDGVMATPMHAKDLEYNILEYDSIKRISRENWI